MERIKKHSEFDDDDPSEPSDDVELTEHQRSILLEDLNLDDVDTDQSSSSNAEDCVKDRKTPQHTPDAPQKSSIKSPSIGKPSSSKKQIRFNLEPKNLKEKSPQQGRGNTANEPSPKKRKKEEKVPEIINEMEEELERQWASKEEKSNLTVLNVKHIIRSVMTNKYVVDMVRQTVEEGAVTDVPFGPKLTRAKTKELLQQHNEVPLPSLVGFLTPIKSTEPEIDPTIKSLLDEVELSEETSDEEYDPAKDDEQSDGDDKGDTSVASDIDSLPPTPASISAPLTPQPDVSQDGMFKVPQENVGQRTRSKLNLHRLPLESIEQAFVPPDVTQDMYEQECDNPDWHQFLQEFTKPLCLNETVEDDVDNDPEYNILEDEEVEDREEMRKDRAVKVSKRELNALMAELFDYTDNLSSDDETIAQTSESIAALEQSIMQETEEREKREKKEQEELRLKAESKQKQKESYGIHPNQRLLLNQQLRQHVQLTTQHFMQTYKHPVFHGIADSCKSMLITLSGLKDNNICCQDIELSSTMAVIADWEQLHTQPDTGQRIRQFVENQLEEEKRKRLRKKNASMDFPPEMMRLVLNSEAFLYPSLLPPHPFRTTLGDTGQYSFTRSENMLLALCLEQVTQLMESNSDVYRQHRVCDRVDLIYQMTMPRSCPKSIAANIRRLKSASEQNPVKCFFETGKAPTVLHYVIPIQPGLKLHQLPAELFPPNWKKLLYSFHNKQHLSVATSDDEPIVEIELPNVKSMEEIRNEYKSSKTIEKQSPKNLRKPRKSKVKIKQTIDPSCSAKSSQKDQKGLKHEALNSHMKTISGSYSSKTNSSVVNKQSTTFREDTESLGSYDNLISRKSTVGRSENKPHGCCDHCLPSKSDLRKAHPEKPRLSERPNRERSTEVSNVNNLSKGAAYGKVPRKVHLTADSNDCVINGDVISSDIPYANGVDESSISQSSSEALPTRYKSFGGQSSTRSVSHKPKPPSTVKLKETVDLTAKHNLGKTKVPTSFRRPKPILDPNR